MKIGFLISLFLATTLHAEETRTKIAIIDTGIRTGHSEWICEGGDVDLTGEGIHDNNGHGTNIAGIIARGLSPKTHCFIIVKWYDSPSRKANTADAIGRAVVKGAQYINLSLCGEGAQPRELQWLTMALSRGIKVIVSAGNDGKNLGDDCYAYPACYPLAFPYGSFFVVQDYADSFSNYGGPVNQIADGHNVEGWDGIVMSGTSQAAAVITNQLIKAAK